MAAGTEKVAAAALRIGDTVVLSDGRYVITRRDARKPKTMVFKMREASAGEGAREFEYTPWKRTMIKREAKR